MSELNVFSIKLKYTQFPVIKDADKQQIVMSARKEDSKV